MRKKHYIVYRILILLIISASYIFFTAWMQNKQVPDEKQKKVQEKKTEKQLLPDEETSGPADTVMIGAYVISIYDMNFPSNKVAVDFYVWYNTTIDSLDLMENFEVVNAIEYTKTHENNERRGNIIYQNFRVNSVIKKEWDIAHFPFDKQIIEIAIEDYDKDISKLVFIPDTAASKIDNNIHIGGWKITGFGIKVNDHVYETNYGDPEIPMGEYSSYSRVIVYASIEREGKGLFFKLFLGLFISALISLLTFFIDPVDLDPRFGLSVGAIFAAIASQYVITSTLPQNAKFTLVDILHDISFIFIFLCIIGSVISLHLKKHDKIKQHLKLDKYGFYILCISYLLLVIYFVNKAI